uniref:Pentacotripeptide-repeat region of PRORP domain-containing protein n=1 Tax=Eutreptiella gymnastica TaxID=73025 RepID=A0A7S1JHA6_9EUGL|mmetsp:Transcript_96543/g.166423  ORF Transcript_96543/g.166423 Transcript_96543/m.166423 type:complete len:195 (+) Transcript_96543:285-869(+)
MFGVRRVARIAAQARFYSAPAPAAAGGKRYDIFGYEVSTAVGPFIEKIKKCNTYDDAGEVIVEMNMANTPPDLATYNALLERICNCSSKAATPISGESKFCAMMDVLEEMDHRQGIKPNAESWGYVLKDLINSGDFRLAMLCIEGMKSSGLTADAGMVSAVEAAASKAASSGTDFPAYLKKATPENFDTKAWGV